MKLGHVSVSRTFLPRSLVSLTAIGVLLLAAPYQMLDTVWSLACRPDSAAKALHYNGTACRVYDVPAENGGNMKGTCSDTAAPPGDPSTDALGFGRALQRP